MSFFFGDTAGDGFANNWWLYTHPSGRVECAPRSLFQNVFTPITATTYWTMCFFEKDFDVTNLGVYVGTTAAGTPTSSWLGLWSHTTPPTIRGTTVGNAAWVYPSTRNGTTTITKASGTWPISLTGRLITGTGITGGTWVVSQTTTTLTLSAAASGSGSMDVTVGQFVGDRYNLAFTTNGTTGAIAANAAYSRPLTAVYKIPASGPYYISFTAAATTMPTLVARTGDAAVPTSFYNDAPAWTKSHVSGTTNNTAPGVNPPSGGTLADMRNIIYMFAT